MLERGGELGGCPDPAIENELSYEIRNPNGSRRPVDGIEMVTEASGLIDFATGGSGGRQAHSSDRRRRVDLWDKLVVRNPHSILLDGIVHSKSVTVSMRERW